MAIEDILGGLGGIVKGMDTAALRDLQMQRQRLAMQQLIMQQQAGNIGWGALQNMPTPQQQAPAAQPVPLMPPQQKLPSSADFMPGMTDLAQPVKGSWFGNYSGQNQWRDPSDSGAQAGGMSVEAGQPGIALPSRSTLGQQFDVTSPSGQTTTLPQTDIGPAARTGRGVDINAPAAEAMGYTPQTFPTDAPFKVTPHTQLALNGQLGTGGAPFVQAAGLPAVKDAGAVAGTAISQFPQQQWGGIDSKALVKAIDQAAPDAPGSVKLMAYSMVSKVLAPDEKMQFQLWMRENQQQFQLGLKEQQIQNQQQMLNQRQQFQQQLQQERQGQGSFVPYQPPGGGPPVAFNTRTGQAQPTNLPSGSAKVGTQAAGEQASQAEVNYWSEVIKNGGSLPPGLARTAAGSKIVQQIMKNIAGAGSDPGDFISKHSEVKANTTSLTNMTRMADAATAFEKTASLNFDKALQLAPDAVPTELGPFFNRYIEEGETMFGDPNVPPYVAAILTAANEYAKIMSGATGSVGSTVDSRKEARDLFSPYLSLPQLRNVIAVAKNDMHNRMQSNFGQISSIKQRLGATGGDQPAGPDTTGQITPGYKEGGYIFKGGDPSDPNSWTQAPEGAVETR